MISLHVSTPRLLGNTNPNTSGYRPAVKGTGYQIDIFHPKFGKIQKRQTLPLELRAWLHIAKSNPKQWVILIQSSDFQTEAAIKFIALNEEIAHSYHQLKQKKPKPPVGFALSTRTEVGREYEQSRQEYERKVEQAFETDQAAIRSIYNLILQIANYRVKLPPNSSKAENEIKRENNEAPKSTESTTQSTSKDNAPKSIELTPQDLVGFYGFILFIMLIECLHKEVTNKDIGETVESTSLPHNNEIKNIPNIVSLHLLPPNWQEEMATTANGIIDQADQPDIIRHYILKELETAPSGEFSDIHLAILQHEIPKKRRYRFDQKFDRYSDKFPKKK